LALANPDTAIAGLRERYIGIAKLGDKLPAHEIIQTPEGFDIEALIKILPEDWSTDPHNPSNENTTEVISASDQEALSQPSTPTPAAAISKPAAPSAQSINKAALALAFFGWNAVADAAAGLVGCKACFRRLGLWMYKPKENGDVTVYSSLEVATEHMEYCPWIDRLAQSGTGRANEKPDELRSGWEAVVEALKVKHRRRIRSTTFDSPRTERSTSPAETFGGEEDAEKKKTADREWWAKIRRMRQVLTTKTPRHKPIDSK
jgi:Rsm1-like.